MSSGDEQGFGGYQEPPFGRQSPASLNPVHGTLASSLSSSPRARSTTTYHSLPSTLHHHHVSTFTNNPASVNQLGNHRERDSPDPADYYRGAQWTSTNVTEEINNAITDMVGVGQSAMGGKVSPMPANMLEAPHTRRPMNPSSVSPAMGNPTYPSGARPRQASFKDLINKFNNAPDQVLPLPSAPRTTSRTVSPSGNASGERNRTLPRSRPYRDSLPESITSNPHTTLYSTPSSPETNRGVPPPLSQRNSEQQLRQTRLERLSPIQTSTRNNTRLTRLRRRGSDGSLPSPNSAFLGHADESSATIPLTPTAWYLGHTDSLEAVEAGLSSGNHRRIRSDLDNSKQPPPLASPWNSEMALRAPLLRAQSEYESPPGSPNSRSRIPVSSHRLINAFGTESLSPSSNPTFRSRSAAINSPPKGTSRLPIRSPHQSPPRMPQNDFTSFAPMSHGTRDLTTTQTRNQLSESSRRLQAYIAAPPPKKSPPLRSSRPRKPVSNGVPTSPGSKIGDRVSSLQKHVNASPQLSQAQPRKLPELDNVDLEARRQHIQRVINRNKHEKRDGTPAIQPRRRSSVLSEDPKPLADDSSVPNLMSTDANTWDRVTTTTQVKDSRGEVDSKANGVHPAPKLHIDTSHSSSTSTAPHTSMDSPTLGLPGGVILAGTGEEQSVSTGALNIDAPNSAITTTSDESHITTFDPEPQSALAQENPSISHRSTPNHNVQIGGSSPSSESCDGPDSSLSGTDRESVQVMIGETAFYDSSSSRNSQELQSPTIQPAQSDHQPHNRWSASSWSSGQHHNSAYTEHCDEDGEDFYQPDHKTEPPTQSCSAVSTRSASIAGDNNALSLPLQDHGVIGPSTLLGGAHREYVMYNSPPNLVKRAKWDSKRLTQLYLEELTRGRGHGYGAAAQVLSESQPHPVTPPANENVSIANPRFQDAKLSHMANLGRPDDWEHASPSVMDWMQRRADAGTATTSPVADETPHEEVHTPRLMPSTQNDGLGLSLNSNVHDEKRPFPPRVSSSHHLSSESVQDGAPTGNLPLYPSNNSESGPPRAVGHSPDSSEDSSVRRIVTDEYSRAPDSSATSLAPSTDQTGQTETRKSPSPEQHRLKKRQNIIKELVDTEQRYVLDMTVIKDFYQKTDVLDADDFRTLFGNSEEVRVFSGQFLRDLEEAVKSIYIIPDAQRRTSQHNRESQLPEPGSLVDQSPEYAGMSDLEKDRSTSVGHVFIRHVKEMKEVYTVYLQNHDAANKKLQNLQRDPDVAAWLNDCSNEATNHTAAWNLDSLLVKPMQRILKYPLLLQGLLNSTLDDHPDHAAIANALEEVTNISHSINQSKSAEPVGQTPGRKRVQSDVRGGLSKAFGRYTEKFRSTVNVPGLFEDETYDMLAQRFGEYFVQLQVVMRDVESYSSDMQIWATHFSEYAAAMQEVTGNPELPSSYPELEAKWHRFKITVQDIATSALPDHVSFAGSAPRFYTNTYGSSILFARRSFLPW